MILEDMAKKYRECSHYGDCESWKDKDCPLTAEAEGLSHGQSSSTICEVITILERLAFKLEGE